MNHEFAQGKTIISPHIYSSWRPKKYHLLLYGNSAQHKNHSSFSNNFFFFSIFFLSRKLPYRTRSLKIEISQNEQTKKKNESDGLNKQCSYTDNSYQMLKCNSIQIHDAMSFPSRALNRWFFFVFVVGDFVKIFFCFAGILASYKIWMWDIFFFCILKLDNKVDTTNARDKCWIKIMAFSIFCSAVKKRKSIHFMRFFPSFTCESIFHSSSHFIIHFPFFSGKSDAI